MSRHARPPQRSLPRTVIRFARRPRMEFSRSGSTLPETYEDIEDQVWSLGFCMLRCHRRDCLVTQIGDVGGPGVHMPLYSCLECYREILLMLDTWVRERDGVLPQGSLRELHERLLARSELV